MKPPNYYARLGLTRDATLEEIRHAYRQAALRLHPDVNFAPGETELFLGIKEAYDVLSDTKKRADYDAIHPSEDEATPLNLNLLYSSAQLPRLDEPQLVYALLGISPAPDYFKATAPPLNVCLVLDRSTSMKGVRMDAAKRTVIELARTMNSQGILSIVTFSDQAEVLLPAGSQLKRDDLETKIHRLRTQGGTEIYRGLEAGLTELRRNLRSSAISHLILLTDGHTYGDEAECLLLSDRAAEEGVDFSILGVGTDWNDAFLDSLAARTGGESIYISKEEDIERYLKKKFRMLSEIYVQGLLLELNFDPGVELRAAYRLEPDASVLEIVTPLRLGSIPESSRLRVLLELLVAPLIAGIGQITLAKGPLTFRIPTRPLPSFTMHLTLERPVSDNPNLGSPPEEILHAMRQITLYRMQEKARQEASQGEVHSASRRLRNVATSLLSRGEGSLAQAVMAEAARLLNGQDLSEEGKKRLKYGTRALFRSKDSNGRLE